MSEMVRIQAKVLRVICLAEGVYDMWLKAPQVAEKAKPGQFINIYCQDKSLLLPRPISICEVNKEEESLRLVYRVVGKGTLEFSKYVPGQLITVLGPIGNGFTLQEKKALIIGGGIGIPPMLQLVKELNCEKTIVLGYKDQLFLNEEFTPYGKVLVSTEDGSAGTKGNVIDAIRANDVEAEVIYACGPMPMLRGVKAYAKEKGIPAWISLEERMACGVGACLGCVNKTREVDHHTHVHNTRICKEGPVFDANDVEI